MPDIRVSDRSSALQLWVIGALAPVAFYFIGDNSQRDFDLLWAAARLALSGSAPVIYGDVTQILPEGLDWGEGAVFPYPPHALFFFTPFGLLPHFTAFLAWNLATATFFLWAARPYLPQGFPPILAVLTPASLICLDFGQTGLLMGALWLLAFQGRWPAVALLTFKPHLGVLSILSIRNVPTVLKVALLALALIAASALIFGPGLWLDFPGQLFGHGARVGSMDRWFFAGVAPAMTYGLIGWAPFAVAGALLLARNVNVFTASTATFLISPFGFHYDMTVASLGFGLLVASRWHELPIRHRIPVALGFLSPVIAIAGSWLVPPLLLWALWTQTKYSIPLPRA